MTDAKFPAFIFQDKKAFIQRVIEYKIEIGIAAVFD